MPRLIHGTRLTTAMRYLKGMNLVNITVKLILSQVKEIEFFRHCNYKRALNN